MQEEPAGQRLYERRAVVAEVLLGPGARSVRTLAGSFIRTPANAALSFLPRFVYSVSDV